MLLNGNAKQLLSAAWNLAAFSPLRNASQYVGTFVLKRRNRPELSKRSLPEGTFRRLRRRHFVYDTVERPCTQPLPNIDVILTQYVEGLGKVGDKVSVKVTRAHNQLLALDKAVYASPENIEKYRNLPSQSVDEEQHSSIYSASTASVLSRQVLAVTVNLDEPWTLEPWHVRVSFRKAGFVVPERCLQLPARPIQGPDVERLEGREFIVTVTVNNCERVPVRCRLHHYATDPRDRLPYQRLPWLKTAEAIFEEEVQQLAAMPRPFHRHPDDDDDTREN